MRRIIVVFGALLPLALAGLASAETSAPAAGRLTIVRTLVDDLKARSESVISGPAAFQLYDTLSSAQPSDWCACNDESGR